MSNYIGRTMLWDGWKIQFEAHKITVSPCGSQLFGGGMIPVTFLFDDMRDCIVMKHVEQIMATLNMGAQVKARQIRASLGVNIRPEDGATDNVHRRMSIQEIVYYGWERKIIPWEPRS